MHITITGIIALFLFFSAPPVHAQRWKEQIRAMLSPAPDAPGHRVSLDMPGNPERREALVFLSAFLTDSIYMVRARALEVSTAIALQTRDTITRQMCVRMLMHPVEGGDFDVAGSALSLLRGFARTDFSTEVRDTISSLIRKQLDGPLVVRDDDLVLNPDTITERHDIPGRNDKFHGKGIVCLTDDIITAKD